LTTPRPPLALDLDTLDFAKGDGLVTIVVQHAHDDVVLMVAHADREALEATLRTGAMHFHSRSRKRLWKKGESSGNVLSVVSLEADCDRDAVLARCLAAGPTCHTGTASCFGEGEPHDAIRRLESTVAARAEALASGAAPEAPSYTQKLLGNRNLRLKKLGEEMAELVVALADDDRPRVAEEAADVVYHLVVALRAAGVGLDAVRDVLTARAGPREPTIRSR
jgi:phosphoribosyl-ATP pyrophosphohydrolase/phosphoribosyl-AMP cyclohydrolase